MANDQLSLIAELGIGFAGFLAIFLIFARREGRFSPADGIRIRAIVATSFIAVFMALVPLLLAQSELEATTVWRISSLVFLAVAVLVSAAIGRTELALPPEQRAEVGMVNNIVGWGLAFLSTVLLATNTLGIFGDSSALPYLVALVSCLGIATSNFIAIALQRLL